MRRKTILFVEDDPGWKTVISHILEEHGYKVLNSNNALNALSLAAFNDIDVCILDWELPGFKGDSVEDWFEKRHIPTFYYTAHDPKDIRVKCYTELPILEKNPKDFSELLSVVEALTSDYQTALQV